MALLLAKSGHAIAAVTDLRPQLAGALPPHTTPQSALVPEPLQTQTPNAVALLHNMADRIGHINDEAVKMAALARGDRRRSWPLFAPSGSCLSAPPPGPGNRCWAN